MNATTPESFRVARLTAREHEVLHWVAEGKANGDIGVILGCSEGTIKKHLQHIFPKLGVETRTAAAIVYLQRSAQAPTVPAMAEADRRESA